MNKATICRSLIVGLSLIQFAQAIPKANFFPYSTGTRLPDVDDSFLGPIVLSQPFKFFNAVHDSLFVNNNGAVSFLRGVPEFTPVCGALDATSKLIAPFWGDVDNRRGGSITHRESSEQAVLNQANAQLLRSFPNYPVLNMNWAFISTWDSVPYFLNGFTGTRVTGNCTGPETNTNTFQLILTSDGTRSFAIFYYDELTWTTGTASGGNCSGLGGQPAKAGFDVGDGVTFISLPGSCTDNVLDIAHNSNVGETGVWIWRVDGQLEDPPAPAPPTTEDPLQPELPLEPISTSPISPVCPAASCPADTRSPCANKIADLIDHLIRFYNEAPFACFGGQSCGLPASLNPFDDATAQPSNDNSFFDFMRPVPVPSGKK